MTLSEKLKEGEWVLVVSNRFWFHYVYIFSLAIKVYQWLLWKAAKARKLEIASYFEDWADNHTLIVKDGKVQEMIGEGMNDDETITHWLNKQNRTVKVFKLDRPFRATQKKPYDFFGIPNLAASWFRKIILNTGNTWNGKDGIPEGKDGSFCSEDTSDSCHVENSWIWMPSMIKFIPGLQYVGTIETTRIKQNQYESL